MSEARYLHLRGALGSVRTEQYDGREHLVVPVVALMEGVIHAVNASTPERVTAAMLTRAAHSWNGRPLVLGHPTKDGRQCTANDPAIEASHRFGTIFNSRMSGQKLLMDAYVDLVRAEKLGGAEFVRRLRDGEQCEVSVGAFVTTDSVAGSHNGKAYKATWLETAGDHLAFLPNGVGACSIDMGCGAHRAAMHLVTAEGIETLGGPGSGWTAENGHVPGSQGGSPMQVVAGSYGYMSNDGSNFKHPEGHTLTINDAGWIHIKSSAFPRNRIEKSGLKVEGLEKYLQKFHMRNLEDGDGMKSLDRLASFFRSLMPRGWGDDEVKQELRDALQAVEPALRNGGEIVRVKNDAVIYCLYPPANYYDIQGTPPAVTYWSRDYTFNTETQRFEVSGMRVQVEPTTVYAPIRTLMCHVEEKDGKFVLIEKGKQIGEYDTRQEADAAKTKNDKMRTAGGPGSGWTAENGHVPGSQGGSGSLPERHASASKSHDVAATALSSAESDKDKTAAVRLSQQAARETIAATGSEKENPGSNVYRDTARLAIRASKAGELTKAAEYHRQAERMHLKAVSALVDSKVLSPGEEFSKHFNDSVKKMTEHQAGARKSYRKLAERAEYEDCSKCDGMGEMEDGTLCEACEGSGELKTAELKAACRCEEADVTKADRIAALLKDEHNPIKNIKVLEAASDDVIGIFEVQAASNAKQVVDKKAVDDKAAADLKAAQDRAKSVEDQLAELKAASAKQLSEEEYLAKAPESIRTLVADKKAQDAAAKATVVATLKVAAKGVYSDEELDKMALPELMKLAQLAKVEAPDYSGRGIAAPRHAGEDYASPDPYEAGLKALRQTVN